MNARATIIPSDEPPVLVKFEDGTYGIRRRLVQCSKGGWYQDVQFLGVMPGGGQPCWCSRPNDRGVHQRDSRWAVANLEEWNRLERQKTDIGTPVNGQ